jgi:hypothetical protein
MIKIILTTGQQIVSIWAKTLAEEMGFGTTGYG